jgi:hypothetical protein
MEKLGIGLTAAAFAILTFLLVIAVVRGTPQASPWPFVLAGALALAGAIVATKSVRQMLRWSRLSLFLMLIAILTLELVFNPRCAVVLDFDQHGCHSPMIAIVLGAIGVVLSRIKD